MTGWSHPISPLIEGKESLLPHQTFFNLPEGKRQMILDLAIDEFARCNYLNASISRIVDRAGIAKGSFYQYFSDKRDLYCYLLDIAIQEKIAFLQAQEPPNPSTDFFTYLRRLLEANLTFDLSQSHLSQILYRAWCSNAPGREQILQQITDPILAFYRSLVAQGISQGILAPDINPDLGAFLLNALVTDLRRFLAIKLSTTPEQLAQDRLPDEHKSAIQEVLDDLVRILEHGLTRASF